MSYILLYVTLCRGLPVHDYILYYTVRAQALYILHYTVCAQALYILYYTICAQALYILYYAVCAQAFADGDLETELYYDVLYYDVCDGVVL